MRILYEIWLFPQVFASVDYGDSMSVCLYSTQIIMYCRLVHFLHLYIADTVSIIPWKEERQGIINIFWQRTIFMACAALLVKTQMVDTEDVCELRHAAHLQQGLTVCRIACTACRPDIEAVSVGRLSDYIGKIFCRLRRTVHAGKCTERPAVATDRKVILESRERLVKSIPCRYSAHREPSNSPMVARCRNAVSVCYRQVCAILRLNKWY